MPGVYELAASVSPDMLLHGPTPAIREKCLHAFQTTLWHDGKMTAREEEIFLAATMMLHCSENATATES